MARWTEVVLNLPVYQSFTYKNPHGETELAGKRVEVWFGSRKIIGFAIADADALPENFPVAESAIKPIVRVIDAEKLYGDEEISIARWVASFYLCAEGEALGAMLPSGKRETDHGMAILDDQDFSDARAELSDEQEAAVRGIVDETDARSAYVFGVTGSGKTEVFLQAAEATLAKGRGIIYLVPEIALTHQVIEAVVRRFGNLAAILHSGLTGSQRLKEWMRLRRGEAKIAVGARSAVFAPVQNLGLIIVDEEHDGSYKSSTTPRYHARQVAMRRVAGLRAKGTPCSLVMGSATPSLEAWHQMKTGALKSFRLTKRLAGGGFPAMEIVPLGTSDRAISARLAEEIRSAKEAGRQSIIFLNRRGFTHFFRCNTCGHEILCKNCSVPLTWHRSEGAMKCHYCGWSTRPPDSCPECGSLDVGYAGFGTEYIEEEVRRSFPGFSIRRVDTDAMANAEDTRKALEEFRSGQVDILLGTQMVAKGLNFPGVRLVGIALADTSLHMPDFRASERTFSLIVQVAGRAGRFFPDGRVIVQTWSPHHPAIEYARRCDVEGFFERELAEREELGFPPFARLVRLVFRSKDARLAEKGAEGAGEILRPMLPSDAELLGPAECPIALLSGNARHQIILRGPRLQPLQNAVRAFLTDYKTPPALYVETDVDPVTLL